MYHLVQCVSRLFILHTYTQNYLQRRERERERERDNEREKERRSGKEKKNKEWNINTFASDYSCGFHVARSARSILFFFFFLFSLFFCGRVLERGVCNCSSVCRSPTLEYWFLFFLFFFFKKRKNRESGRSVICHRSNMFPQVASV